MVNEFVSLGGLTATLGAVAGLYKVINDSRNATNNAVNTATTELVESLRNDVHTVRMDNESIKIEHDVLRRQLNLVITDRDDLARSLYGMVRWIESGCIGNRPTIPQHLSEAFHAAGIPWP